MTLNGPTRGCVPVRPFVRQVYAGLLERDVDYGGFTSWSDALARHGVPRSAVANAITASDEYRGHLIRGSYERYLGRGPDREGQAFWLTQMRAGRHIEEVQAGFIASDEFWATHGATPSGWVTGLYQSVLGRTPAAAEVAWWVERMRAGSGRGDVARGFLYSTEHLTAVVDGYYIDLLGRHLDPSGQATWVRLIQQGSRDEQIIAGILASEEYAAKVKRLWPGD